MIVTDIIDPEELTAFVRELDPAEFGFSLDAYLPNQYRETTEYAYTQIDQSRQDAAQYRPFDVPAAIGKRPGFARKRGEIPPMSKKLLLGEEQTLKLAELRGQDGLLAGQAFDDAAFLVESVQSRLELARGQALSTGQVTFVNDRGLAGMVLNYGSITALSAPANLWSSVTLGKPLTNMRTWVAEYRAANGGRPPAICLTSDAVISAAMLSDELRAFAGVGATIPSILTPEQVNNIFRVHGLPPMVSYEVLVQVAGSVQRVIPENKVILLPPASTANFGETTFGITAEALELVGSGYLTVPTAPGLAGVTLKTYDPVHTWTKVSALAVPVIKDTAKIATATVLA